MELLELMQNTWTALKSLWPVLLVLAVMGLAAAAGGTVWHARAQR